MTKVWLVTGSASGLGRNIAEAVLASGDRLVATARDPRRLDGIVLRHPPCHAHTQNFFQPLFAIQSAMCIAWISRMHRETLLPLAVRGGKARVSSSTQSLRECRSLRFV